MTISGRAHGPQTLRMRVQGSGTTLTAALEDAMSVALQAIPEAREVTIAEYTFEVEAESFSAISDPIPARRISQVVAEVDLYAELRETSTRKSRRE